MIIRNTRHDHSAIARREIAGPRGVGGWLLLYCILITVIFPLRAALSVFQSYEQFWGEFGLFPRLAFVVYIDAIVQFGLVVLALKAGISLWNIGQRARERNRVFQITYLLVMVAEPIFFLAIANWPEQAPELVRISLIGSAVGAVLWFAIWWNYFERSRRVRNTYGEATLPPTPRPVV